MEKYEYSLIDEILNKKEEKERREEEEQRLKVLNTTKDETDCRLWDIDTTVQYFIWLLKNKSPAEVEEIMTKLIDAIKG